jgi:putative hydrolase of the HAD superfamily
MAQKPVTTVLFDLGFTLINFEGDFMGSIFESYKSLAKSLFDAGIQFDKESFAEKYGEIMITYYNHREIDLVERPVELFVQQALEFFGHKDISLSVIKQAISEMFIVTESGWHVEPDTHSTLTQLLSSGYRLGMISNASNLPDINRLIDNHKLRPYFECISVSAEEKIRKPDPQIFHRTLMRMGVKPENAVMVGDTLQADVLGAHRAGMRGIWLTRRVDTSNSKISQNQIIPDAELSDLASLIPLLESWSKETSPIL